MSDPIIDPSQVTSYSKWIIIFKNMVFHTKGEGASSTKGVYIGAATTVCLCLLLMTITFNWVYWRWHKADTIFAAAIGAMTLALIGFASNSQNVKAKNTIGANSDNPPKPPDPSQQ